MNKHGATIDTVVYTVIQQIKCFFFPFFLSAPEECAVYQTLSSTSRTVRSRDPELFTDQTTTRLIQRGQWIRGEALSHHGSSAELLLQTSSLIRLPANPI